jgi:Zn-dependent protease with chaperone function
MFRQFALFSMVAALTACVATKPAPVSRTPYEEPMVQRSGALATANYRRMAARVEPVAERACRSLYPQIRMEFCDFTFQVLDDPKQPPNAFQSIGRDGRPVITFNINMLRTVKNDHEIAFIMGHEAGHQIAQHINQRVDNSTAGALLGGLLMVAIGADPQAGVDLGGAIGGQAYSKKFELQADRIGTHLASRAGYNPLIGAESFRRTQGSNSLLSTHPPSYDRIQTVEQTNAAILAARARGQVAPIVW